MMMQREHSSISLEGNLEEIPLNEILQLFDFTGKKGVLHLDSSQGKGTISFMENTIMDAHWNNLHGEDAMVEMFNIKEGRFHFDPRDVLPGNLIKPIEYASIETVRLLDELSTIENYIPKNDAQLILGSLFHDGIDADAQSVIQSIRSGRSTIVEIRDHLRFSEMKLKLLIARLIKGGFIKEIQIKGASPEETINKPFKEIRQKITKNALDMKPKKVGTKPLNILIAFTETEMLSRCLVFLGKYEHPVIKKSGFSDFCRFSLSSQVYNIFFLKGDKRFSFIWEPFLKASEGALFIFKTHRDSEHADYFSRAAKISEVPFARISFSEEYCTKGVKLISSPEEMIEVIVSLTK